MATMVVFGGAGVGIAGPGALVLSALPARSVTVDAGFTVSPPLIPSSVPKVTVSTVLAVFQLKVKVVP